MSESVTITISQWRLLTDLGADRFHVGDRGRLEHAGEVVDIAAGRGNGKLGLCNEQQGRELQHVAQDIRARVTRYLAGRNGPV